MANVKISQLPSLSTMTAVAQIPVVAGGVTYQITGANLQNYFEGTYGNANVVANVAALGSNPVSTAGNVTGAYIFGNGSQLTGLPATYGNANVVANLAAFANNPISTTGNVTGGNILTGGLIFVVGNITAGNIKTYTGAAAGAVDALFLRSQALTGGGRIVFNNTNGELIDSANLSFSGTQLSITGAISASGNIAGGNILGGANVNATTHTGTTVSVTGNVTGGNVLTGGLVSATGNITGGNISTGVITLTNSAVIKDTTANAVAFGREAGATTQKNFAVAVGWWAGKTTQGNNSVAVGPGAGYDTQGRYSVAVGDTAGGVTQADQAIAIGTSAGQTTQGFSAIAIGSAAGFNLQSANAVAIGFYAGNTGQGNAAVAVGYFAGATTQGNTAVAIGSTAGQTNQGINAVAIGTSAGLTNQGNNSIILNATGSALDQTTANTFTVAPVRNDVANIGNVMFYNATSKEITYGNVISVAGNITGGNISTGSRVVTTPVAFSTLTAVTGARAFVNDGNLVAATNFGAQVSGGGANTVPIWSDGTNWYIG